MKRKNIIDLLYVNQDNGNTHYCLIKNLESLMNTTKNKSYLCRRCLHGYTTQQALNNHQKDCEKESVARINIPGPGTLLKFKKHQYVSKLPFVIYADFETANMKVNDELCSGKATEVIFKEVPNSFGYKLVSMYEKIISTYQEYYVGEDCVKVFIDKMLSIYNTVGKKTSRFNKAKPNIKGR